MGNTPAFQFYPRQWLGDDVVMLMDWDARGMHIHLMCIAWQQDPGGTLPQNEDEIRRWVGSPNKRTWNRVWPQIQKAWSLEGDRFVQRGLQREIEKQKKTKKKRQEAAEVRWRRQREREQAEQEQTESTVSDVQMQEPCTEDANALQMVCPSSSSSSSSSSADKTQGRDFSWVMVFWNSDIAPKTGLPEIKRWTKTRNSQAARRVKENDEAALRSVLSAPLQSAFLRGEEGRESWTGATVDWLLRPTNFQKVIEGNFTRGKRPGPAMAVGDSGDWVSPCHPGDVEKFTDHPDWDNYYDAMCMEHGLDEPWSISFQEWQAQQTN